MKTLKTALLIFFLSLSFLSVLQFWQIKQVEATTIFSDGFETGDFTQWTGSSGTAYPNDTAILHSGSYAANATGAAVDYYCYETFADQSPIYARQYIRIGTLPSDGNALTFMMFWVGGLYLFKGWVLGNSTAANWAIVARDTGDTAQANVSIVAVSVGTWYCVEAKWIKNNAAGGAALFVDGVEVINSTGYTTKNSDVATVRFGLDQTYPSSSLWWDDCVIATSYIGPIVIPPTEGAGEVSDWAYRISGNSTSCYIIDSAGTVIYDNAAFETVLNTALTYADGNATKSIYVYPDNYETTDMLGPGWYGGTSYSNVYLQFGPSTNITRTAAGTGDYLLQFHDYSYPTTFNLTITSNGTVAFNAAQYCDGFELMGQVNSTYSNMTIQHLKGQGFRFVRSRYCDYENLTVFSPHEITAFGLSFEVSDVQYSTFNNIEVDANDQGLSEGFYIGDWDSNADWNGSYFNTFEKIWVHNTHRNGFYLNAGAGYGVYNNTFTNCTAENNAQTGYAGIKLRPAVNNTFTDFIIRNMTGGVTTGTQYDAEGSPTQLNCTGNYVQADLYDITVDSLILTSDGSDQSVDNNFFNLTQNGGKGTYFSNPASSPIHHNTIYFNLTDCDGLWFETGNISYNTFYLNFTRCGGSGYPDIRHSAGWTEVTENDFYVYATSGNPNGLYDFVNGTQNNYVYYPYTYAGISIEITFPENVTYYSSSIPVSFVASGGTIDDLWFNCDNASTWVYASNQTYSGVTYMTGFINGTYTFYAWANNTIGDIAEETIMFTVEITVNLYGIDGVSASIIIKINGVSVTSVTKINGEP